MSRALFEHWYDRDRRYGFSEGSGGFELLAEACAALHTGGGDAGRDLAIWLVAEEWALVEKTIDHALKDPWKPHVQRGLTELGGPVARIVRATAAAHAEDQRNTLVRYLVTQESRALMPLLVSILRACREQIAPRELQPLGLGVLLEHCTTALSALAAEPARESDDWSMAPQ